VRLACRQIVERLSPFAEDLKGTEFGWSTLVGKVMSGMAGMSPKVGNFFCKQGI
jgi:hypothetical protein